MTATMPERATPILADDELLARQLGQLGRDLDAEVTRYGRIEEDAVGAEGDFRVAFARAFVKADGRNADMCKQIAILETDPLWRAMAGGQALVRVQRESLRALHARIDIGRTMVSRVKAQMGLAGRDGST